MEKAEEYTRRTVSIARAHSEYNTTNSASPYTVLLLLDRSAHARAARTAG